MKNTFFWICFLLINLLVSGQQDSIYLYAKIHNDLKTIDVNQTIELQNQPKSNTIQLLNWINAYKKRGTTLSKRSLENNNKNLHFAKDEELGHIGTIQVRIADSTYVIHDESKENILLTLPSSVIQQERVKIELNYQLSLPSAKFTGYGYADQEVLLKYFFLVPDGFKDITPQNKTYQNIEETAHYGDHWRVDLEVPTNFNTHSNLTEKAMHSFEGTLNEDAVFLISKKNYPQIKTQVNGQPIRIDFGYPIDAHQLSYLEFYAALQLQYIKERTGVLPSKLFITKKFQQKENFFGNDDIKFWKFRFPLFSIKNNVDLDYFSIFSKKVLQQSLINYKEKDHSIINGIKTYLEIEYLKKHYPNKRLLGDLPDISIYKIQPLKWFHVSKMKLLERYNLGYRYVMTRNLDQKITEDYSALSNLNQLAISHFESGRSLHFISEKIGKEKFHQLIRNYIKKHKNRPINSESFIHDIRQASKEDFAFIKDVLNKKHRINFNLKKAKVHGDSIHLNIQHNLPKNVPFIVESIDNMGRKHTEWLKTKSNNKSNTYRIANKTTKKIIVNNSMYLPERNYRDNYLYPQSFFSNIKKVKFSLFKDIENPEYNEIYLNPRLNFNAYDNVLLGLNFSNRSFLDKKINYSLTPYYSTGTGRVTGSGALIYRVMPVRHFLQKINFGIKGSYFHYNYDNTYKKASLFTTFLLRKEPRSTINRQLTLAYNHFNKELPKEVNPFTNYSNYNIFNVNYTYVDNKLIHEKFLGLEYQAMEDFQKISAQAFYRYEFARNKKLSIRWFGGYFLNNNTKNDGFNFGISKVPNYGFNYGLLGQSATSGLFSQQYILADGGFKSYLGSNANQWITSVNSDIAVWKMIHLYGDAGWFKNRDIQPKFIWDSGVNIRIIPDFLEIYFPIYSSLGFEPQFKDYGKRIRFKLVFNTRSITRILRRGWY